MSWAVVNKHKNLLTLSCELPVKLAKPFRKDDGCHPRFLVEVVSQWQRLDVPETARLLRLAYHHQRQLLTAVHVRA